MDLLLLVQMAEQAAHPRLGIFGALLGAVAPALIGGFLNRKSAKDQQSMAYTQNKETNQGLRRWTLSDRKNERAYSEKITAQDRKYAASLTADDRKYAAKVLTDQRDYDRKSLVGQRKYDAKLLAADKKYQSSLLKDDRKYSEKRLADGRKYLASNLKEDRSYLDQMYKQDISQFNKDRDFMQSRSNELAEKSAASRGIDFKSLVADATAAGFNPMTAMSMAHAYSRNVDYTLQGGVYSPRANYTATGYNADSGAVPTSGGGVAQGGGSGGGSGGGAGAALVPSQVMPAHMPAAGGFSVPGAGYGQQYNPALSSGSFIQEAMQNGVDTWFNRPEPQDKLAEALRGALAQKETREAEQSSRVPGSMGFDLKQVEAFKPAVSVGLPPLARNAELRPAPSPFRQEFVTVRHPDGHMGRIDSTIARRLDIKKYDTLSVGDWEELVGDNMAAELETNAATATVRKTALGDPSSVLLPETIRDFIEGGVTGVKQLRFPRRSTRSKRRPSYSIDDLGRQ